jgi:flagellum-specific peptidoglycan hydrolase FlgJ
MLYKKFNSLLRFILFAITVGVALPIVAQAKPEKPEPRDLMRDGIGDWCYDPVGPLTKTQKQDYVDYVITQGRKVQETYGVPGALLAAMSIRESGYGRTRLSILSNNVLSFKMPKNVEWQFDRPTFELWCQPKDDQGNKYLIFGSRAAAFDYVAKVLAQRPDMKYAEITQKYRDAIANGVDGKLAATKWLEGIAKIYATDKEYVPQVLHFADNPMASDSSAANAQSLWELIPPK